MSKSIEDYSRIEDKHYCQYCEQLWPMERVSRAEWVCRKCDALYTLYVNDSELTKESCPFLFAISWLPAELK